MVNHNFSNSEYCGYFCNSLDGRQTYDKTTTYTTLNERTPTNSHVHGGVRTRNAGVGASLGNLPHVKNSTDQVTSC
jgi:hypothetical protein